MGGLQHLVDHGERQPADESADCPSAGGTRSQLGNLWASSGQSFCQSATANRYPVYANASNDMTLDDFTKLFARGGMIDSFFNTNMRSYVDMSRSPWVSQRVNGVDLGIPAGTLAQFQRAATIRDMMFGADGSRLGLSLDVIPVSLDSSSHNVTLEFDGQTVKFDGKTKQPVKVTWPGTGVGHAKISFEGGSGPSSLERDGPWAMFRLLKEGSLHQSGGSDRYTANFQLGGHNASFDIRAASVLNPFGSHAIDQFRCPGHF